MNQTSPAREPQRRGPGAGCLLLVLLIAAGASVVVYGFWQVWSTVSDYEDRYLTQGYVLQQDQSITISEPIEENTYLYARETIRIEKGANASLAISAHEAFIAGTVTGDVAFLGGDIEIQEGAVIQGNLDVTMAHNVVVRGTVNGDITGTWTRIFGTTGTPTPGNNQNQTVPGSDASNLPAQE